MKLIRPGTTLAQVLHRVSKGQNLQLCLAAFLDDFYSSPNKDQRAHRITEDPGLLRERKLDALFGAIGEHLAIRWDLGTPPRWTGQPERFLDRPWFMGYDHMKGSYLAESPLAFRRRFIFTEAEPLRRDSMPRDGRWWAYETIRSGATDS